MLNYQYLEQFSTNRSLVQIKIIYTYYTWKRTTPLFIPKDKISQMIFSPSIVKQFSHMIKGKLNLELSICGDVDSLVIFVIFVLKHLFKTLPLLENQWLYSTRTEKIVTAETLCLETERKSTGFQTAWSSYSKVR